MSTLLLCTYVATHSETEWIAVYWATKNQQATDDSSITEFNGGTHLLQYRAGHTDTQRERERGGGKETETDTVG